MHSLSSFMGYVLTCPQVILQKMPQGVKSQSSHYDGITEGELELLLGDTRAGFLFFFDTMG